MFISHQSTGFLGAGTGFSVLDPPAMTSIGHEPHECLQKGGRKHNVVLSVAINNQKGVPILFIKESLFF